MALSPNYGFPEPDNSSLVKNGAQDIRALGDAVDTAIWNVGFGQAGKNKLINGDFGINQRAFTSNTTSDLYNFDRWQTVNADGTVTTTPQTFTVGTAPVAGYEGKNFLRIVTTGQTLVSARANFSQKIESVRSFAGQTITVSFWAKANSATPAISVEAFQNFGTGGSPSASVSGSVASGTVAKKTISTSWARYSATLTIPSITGKTLGTTNDGFLSLNFWVSGGSDFNTRTDSLGIQSNTFDIWGVQAEYGSKATPFETATGTIQGELAACQRYFYKKSADASNAYAYFAQGTITSTTNLRALLEFPVAMRTSPTVTKTGNMNISTAGVAVTSVSIDGNTATGDSSENKVAQSLIFAAASGLTVGQSGYVFANNDTTANLSFSAEL
jgi:hypothetical protein